MVNLCVRQCNIHGNYIILNIYFKIYNKKIILKFFINFCYKKLNKIFVFRDFCFHLMSFGVVGIAIDRLRTVYGLMQMEQSSRMCFQNGSDQLIFVRVSLAI